MEELAKQPRALLPALWIVTCRLWQSYTSRATYALSGLPLRAMRLDQQVGLRAHYSSVDTGQFSATLEQTSRRTLRWWLHRRAGRLSMKKKIGSARTTVKMCEVKIADLEQENGDLRAQLDAYESYEECDQSGPTFALRLEDLMQLKTTVTLASDYLRQHVCTNHSAQLARALSRLVETHTWLAQLIAENTTEEEYAAADVEQYAESIISVLTRSPFGGVFN